MNLEVNNLHNFTFTYSVLNEISLLLEHVLNICSSFKIDLKEKEEIVRVDEFHRYDRSLFLKTVKDPRLFTLANSSPFPKSLYQNHYFLKFLLLLFLNLQLPLQLLYTFFHILCIPLEDLLFYINLNLLVSYQANLFALCFLKIN